MRRWLLRLAGVIIVVIAGAAAILYTPEIPLQALKAQYTTDRSQFIDIDGGTIHVRDDGDRQGPVLILVHGSNGSLQVWEPWVQRLGESLRIISLDLPGHGLTGPWQRNDYSIAAYADLVPKIADRLNIARFAIGGHSMGGAVAWTVAARQPQRVSQLILVDSAAYPRDSLPPLSLRLAQISGVGEAIAMLKPRWMAADTLRATYANPTRLEPAQVQRYHDLLRREGNRAATLQRLRTAVPLDPAPLKGLTIPTLILWGAQDRWVPQSDARRLHADVAGSELVIYDGTGHAPMEEQPDRSAADVRRFLLK